jgi:hypothetical protein
MSDKAYAIYIVTYDDSLGPNDSESRGYYALKDGTLRTLEDAQAQVKALVRVTGKCYGIANPDNKILVEQSSRYYADLKLRIK